MAKKAATKAAEPKAAPAPAPAARPPAPTVSVPTSRRPIDRGSILYFLRSEETAVAEEIH